MLSPIHGASIQALASRRRDWQSPWMGSADN